MDVSDTSYYIFNEKGNKGSQMGHLEMISSISVYVSYCLTDCKHNVKKLSRNKVISM